MWEQHIHPGLSSGWSAPADPSMILLSCLFIRQPRLIKILMCLIASYFVCDLIQVKSNNTRINPTQKAVYLNTCLLTKCYFSEEA